MILRAPRHHALSKTGVAVTPPVAIRWGPFGEETIWSPHHLIADIARPVTLLAGDLLLMGMPCHSRSVDPAQGVEREITGIGRLIGSGSNNPVTVSCWHTVCLIRVDSSFITTLVSFGTRATVAHSEFRCSRGETP